ncbi:alpha/beta hydrolase [Streptomyces sp. S6]
MSRSRRIGVTAVAALAVLAGSPGLAQATEATSTSPSTANTLPPGWRISGHDLLWRAPQSVPMGDARVEFHANGRLLGVPKPAADGRTFKLALDDAASARRLSGLDSLEVQAGGRRLDAEESGSRSPVTAPAAAPALPANPVDPGKPGPYRTTRGEYSLSSVKLPGFKVPVEMRGLVIAPKGATGKRPVALFLHGRHSTCYKPGTENDVTGEWPCAKGYREIPSHQGYVKDQQLLASQGYVTVSISANGINGQDWEAEDAGAQARSSLVRRHLARWADWAAKPSSAPAVVRDAPRTDLSKVLLVGHSRGGEGVNRAAMDSLYPPPAAQDGAPGKARWHISGTVLIGPTIFAQNPVADVPSATILPGCDGDVSDLQGEVFVDGTRGVSNGKALHSAVYVVGANHNFFNTEWTPGKAQAPAWDDFVGDPDRPDAVCAPGRATRLTADQQHQTGAVYIAAAARLFVAGDDRVRPLLDGTPVRAASAGKAQVLTHAVGANRGAGFLPDSPVTVTGARLCDAVNYTEPKKACGLDPAKGMSPHFAQWDSPREAGRRAVAVSWSKPGTATRISPAKPLSLAGSHSLALRVFVPPNSRGTKLDVTLVDSANRRATLGQVAVDGLPGTASTSSYWAREVRVPLKTAKTFDLKRVKSLEITPRSASGKAWLVDAWGWRPGTPAAQAAALPRVDVGRLTVKEGDFGVRTYRVPVTVSGKGSGQVRYYVFERDSGKTTDKLVTVRPGANTIDVPVKVVGDTRFGYDKQQDIVVKAVHGAVVGNHRGGVTALNDDPEPKATWTPVADKVTEGGTLLWRVTLAETADVDLYYPIKVVPVASGAELSTKDVDPRWLSEHTAQSADPERPLSQADLWVWLVVEAGKTTAEFDVKTVKDDVAEPVESVRFVRTDQNGTEIPGTSLTGTVTDAS